jgi:hypothetical protein
MVVCKSPQPPFSKGENLTRQVTLDEVLVSRPINPDHISGNPISCLQASF